MVPVREMPVPLGATLKLNDPSPDMPPLVIVIHATVLVGVHAQLEPVVTPILLLRPVDAADTVVGDTLYMHCASASRTSSPHHEAQSSANVTPARRSVMHTFCSNPEGHQSADERCAQNCIPRAVGQWPQVAFSQRVNRNVVRRCLPDL
jgi:hypothetical protein